MVQRLRTAGALACSFWLVSGPVWAEDSLIGGAVSSNGTTVTARVTAKSSTGNSGGALSKQAPSSRGSADSRVCKQGAMEIPCSGPYGYWDSSKQCYVSANEELVLNTSDAARRPEGARFLMSCTSPTGQEMFTFWASSPDAAAPPPPPDPQVLARQAVASMQLAPVDLGMHPKPASQQGDALGYVGWNQWMWVSNERDNTMGPISRTASLNGYSVTATAEVDRVVWDMGDGGSVSCGAGTPWRSSVADNQPSPDCGHVYEKDGEFTVTATSYWTVTWSGIGETGSFGMELSNSENHTVAEVQVVNVTGG